MVLALNELRQKKGKAALRELKKGDPIPGLQKLDKKMVKDSHSISCTANAHEEMVAAEERILHKKHEDREYFSNLKIQIWEDLDKINRQKEREEKRMVSENISSFGFTWQTHI